MREKYCRVCGKDISNRVGNVKTCVEHKNMKLVSCSMCGNTFSKHNDNNRKLCDMCRDKTYICRYCGKDYTHGNTGFITEFCSKSCKKKYNYYKLKEETGGNPTYEENRSRTLARRVVFEEYNQPYECSICCSKDDIEVHHINLDPYDNDVFNLQRLCTKCHRAVHVRLLKLNKDNGEVKPHSKR